MAHIFEDRIFELSISTGTGDIALAGAVTAYRAFSSVLSIGDTLPYMIEAVDANGKPTGDYEYGLGTYSAANTITRTTVRGSSNAAALVNFAAGTKFVQLAVCAPASAAAKAEWRAIVGAGAGIGINSDITGLTALVGPGLVPVGATMYFPANVAPTGFIKKNGALLSRSTYAALYAYAVASGNMAANDGAWTNGQFSPGDGSTTFRIPDGRGEFVRGWDDSRGIDSGRAIGSSQSSANLAHTHGQNFGSNYGTSGGSPIGASGSYAGASGYDTASAGGTEARPRNIAELACIKF